MLLCVWPTVDTILLGVERISMLHSLWNHEVNAFCILGEVVTRP